MDLSIIITAHNSSKFLHDAINSAISEKLSFAGKCEIILAIDNVEGIEYNEFIDRVDKHIYTGKRSNLSFNFNLGVSIALGTYIKILAYDDVLIAGSMNKMYTKAISNNSDVLFADFISINQSERIRYITPKDTISNLIINRKISCGASMFKKSSFLSVGGFDTQFAIAEGYCLYLRLIHKGFNSFNYLNEFVIYYRLHNDNKSNRSTKEKRITRELQMDAIRVKYQSIINNL